MVDGVSRRQILWETGMYWLSLKKVLEHSEPPGYRLVRRRRKTKLGDHLGRIGQILKDDQAMPPSRRNVSVTEKESLVTRGKRHAEHRYALGA